MFGEHDNGLPPPPSAHVGSAFLVRQARKLAVLTQQQLAERSGITQSVISRLESGERDADWATVAALVAHTTCCLDVDLIPPPHRVVRSVRDRFHVLTDPQSWRTDPSWVDSCLPDGLPPADTSQLGTGEDVTDGPSVSSALFWSGRLGHCAHESSRPQWVAQRAYRGPYTDGMDELRSLVHELWAGGGTGRGRRVLINAAYTATAGEEPGRRRRRARVKAAIAPTSRTAFVFAALCVAADARRTALMAKDLGSPPNEPSYLDLDPAREVGERHATGKAAAAHELAQAWGRAKEVWPLHAFLSAWYGHIAENTRSLYEQMAKEPCMQTWRSQAAPDYLEWLDDPSDLTFWRANCPS